MCVLCCVLYYCCNLDGSLPRREGSSHELSIREADEHLINVTLTCEV